MLVFPVWLYVQHINQAGDLILSLLTIKGHFIKVTSSSCDRDLDLDRDSDRDRDRDRDRDGHKFLYSR